MKAIKNIIYFILSFQEKLLLKKLNKTLNIKNYSKHKKWFNNGCLLSIDSIAETEKQKIEDDISSILKNVNYDTTEIIEYIKKNNTKVYFIDNIKPVLSVGENIGFIYPQKGFRALYFSLLLDGNFKFKTDELFILDKKTLNKYHLIYNFYNWYTYKHNIYSIDSETQILLNKYLLNDSNDNIKKLQLEEIYKLKDAIKQDKSAIEFVFKLCQKSEATQKALDKLKNNGISL